MKNNKLLLVAPIVSFLILCISSAFLISNYISNAKEVYTRQMMGDAHSLAAEYRSHVIRSITINVTVLLLSFALIFIVGWYVVRRTLKSQAEILNRQKELGMAAHIQESMLSPPSIELPQLRIANRLVPARNVGGDLYYHFQRQNHLYFCIGDVSGKGMPAALFMSKTISLFSNISRYSVMANDIAEQLNMELCQNNHNCMFVTMFIGILNLKTGLLQYCNAGHDEPLFWNGLDNSKPRFLSTSDNIPLGVNEDEQFLQGEVFLSAGSRLFLYTDGVTEAKRKNSEMYGEQRLIDCFTKHCSNKNANMCDVILNDIHTFVDGNEQSDDITMLSLIIRHIDRTIILRNDIEELKKLPDFFKCISDTLLYSPEEIIKVRVAVDEVMTNCIRYAYPGEKDRCIALNVYSANDQLVFIITDEGIPFDPVSYQRDTIEDIMSLDINDIQIGGLGITLMKKAFDEYTYQRLDNKNILTLKYNLNKTTHEN